MNYCKSRILFLVAFLSCAPLAAAVEELSTTTPASKPDEWWQRRQEKINERAKQGDVDLIFIGDSITQGWEGDPGRDAGKSFMVLERP